MPNKTGGVGVEIDDSKYCPQERPKVTAKTDGDAMFPFDRESKVTKSSNNYQGGFQGGYDHNSGTKDANRERMIGRCKEGQVVYDYSATKKQGTEVTGKSSGTAYNGNPIPETYEPATSNGQPSDRAIVYSTIKK